MLESKLDKNNIGILSIDIDGNDYWVWKEISVIDPLIVIIEFNSVFGFNQKVSVPYKENFFRTKAHYSNLFWEPLLKPLNSWQLKKVMNFFQLIVQEITLILLKKNLYKKINFKLKKKFIKANLEKAVILEEIKLLLDIMKD